MDYADNSEKNCVANVALDAHAVLSSQRQDQKAYTAQWVQIRR